MIAKDLINFMIPPLKPTDDLVKAKQWMDEFRLSELPVVDEGKFLGMIDEEMLFNEAYKFPTVGEYPLPGIECLVKSNSHFYDVMKMSNVHGYRLVAVLNDEGIYEGVISIQDVVEAFAKNAAVSTDGAILTLRLTINDYSLSEISRLIEANEAKVLSSYLSPASEDPSALELTLKIDKSEASQIVASLERNGYHVDSTFNVTNAGYDERERLDSLLNYLKF